MKKQPFDVATLAVAVSAVIILFILAVLPFLS